MACFNVGMMIIGDQAPWKYYDEHYTAIIWVHWVQQDSYKVTSYVTNHGWNFFSFAY